MDLGLRNSVALISGSSQGIGAGIAESFLHEGAKVIITGRNQEKLQKKALELSEQFGPNYILALNFDLTQQSNIQQCLAKVIDVHGCLDHLVLNIGSGRSVSDPVPPEEQWEQIFDINFNAAVKLTRECLPQLIQQKKGTILFISSITGHEALGAPVDYSTAKAALNAFSKNLARKVARDGIRVNTISPGNIMFPGSPWEEKVQHDPERFQQLIETTVPMQRFGNIKEIGDTAAFLCSDRAAFITGAVLKVDGGQTVGIV